MAKTIVNFLILIVALVAAILITSSFFNLKSKAGMPVLTDAGIVSGITNEQTGVIAYKGIPYASPPVNDLRWHAPQPVKTWTGIRRCENFGPSPYQNIPKPFSMWTSEFLIPRKNISEDCLYLNVWTPSVKSKKKKPVLVWIYGGGFNTGGSAVPLYDGEAMAKNGIVFVSINYRVGIFGFFEHPDLAKESPGNTSGNYGLMDQVTSLKWVKQNISAFGGDPGNITIAGQSAGAMSINCLIAMPSARGLFNKAILESGAMVLERDGDRDIKYYESQGLRISKQFNCGSISELRNIPAEKLLKEARGDFRPIADGYVLPISVSQCFAQGKQNDVPILTGWNQDDALISRPLKNKPDFVREISGIFGSDTAFFFKLYPVSNAEEVQQSQIYFARDNHFGVQQYTLANIESSRLRDVYVYRFARALPDADPVNPYGAFHSSEIPYAFGNLKFMKRPLGKDDKDLSELMQSYWSNFIATGNPNSKNLPVWPRYSANKNLIINLDKKTSVKPLPEKPALDFLISRISKNK